MIRLCCKRRIDARLRSFSYLRLSAHRISVSVIESLLLAGAKRGVHPRTTQESQASQSGFTIDSRGFYPAWPLQETNEQPDTPKQREKQENKREQENKRSRLRGIPSHHNKHNKVKKHNQLDRVQPPISVPIHQSQTLAE